MAEKQLLKASTSGRSNPHLPAKHHAKVADAGSPSAGEIPPSKAQAADDSPREQQDVAGGLKRIGALVESVGVHFRQAVRKIEAITVQTKILSLNARIEASRAGAVGNAFGIVAMEMVNLSVQTGNVTNELATATEGSISSLNKIIAALGLNVRGVRLSDMAMTNIDVIDRNLYERSCDVRWWATDSSAVDALTRKSPAATEHACKRLGVILDSYTVYFDIVLCDMDGRIVANGRKDQFACMGSSQRETAWFHGAMKTRAGDEFAFQSVHRSPTLAGGKHVLVYSCGVRENGEARGKLVGVLGIVFNWEALGQTIMGRTMISDDEKSSTRVCITDANGLVLADSANRIIEETLQLPGQASLFATKKHHIVAKYKDKATLIAHAFSPGFETYATGWHSLIIQTLE